MPMPSALPRPPGTALRLAPLLARFGQDDLLDRVAEALGGGAAEDGAAVEDGDGVGDGFDLVEEVGAEEDGDG